MNILLGLLAETEILTFGRIPSLQKEKVSFDKFTIPSKIYKGTFVTCNEGILISGPKQLIWDNGVFLIDNK